MVELKVEQRPSSAPDDRQHLAQCTLLVGNDLGEAAVDGAYHVVAYPLGILGHHFQPDALEHVAGKLASL